MSFFGLNFGNNADIDIILDNQDERKMAEIKDENGRKERMFLFYDGESVTGKVNVTLHRKTSRLEHQGIKIEFIGQIELYYDRGNHHEFLSLVKELARPGELTQNTSFEFEFNQVEKPYECYTGANVRLRYFLRVSVARRISDMTKELDLLVHTLATYPEMNNPIKMEVGIEECLHIEFEYNKSKYHLKDVIVGKIYFLLVRIKIRHMEVAIIKRETTGSGPNTFHDNETIAKYEIMDGAPVKGESIPIRVFLAGYDLTPTMRDINKKFSVRYYLNLVLVDEEDRRYFKQQEITLWRKGDRVRKSLLLHQQGHSNYPQIPHAMARHNPGDYPSANVRTAPTPSEPNTPIAEPGVNYIPNAGVVPPPTLPEEDSEPADDTPPEITSTNHQDQENRIPTNNTTQNETNSSVVDKEGKIEEQEKDEEPSKVIQNSSSKPALPDEKTKEVVSNKKEPPEAVLEPRPPIKQQPKSETTTLEDKMSNLNTKNDTINNDDNDRLLPPEDDSVPDMPDEVEDLAGDDDDDAAAVVDLDDDEDEQAIGNDDL